MTVSFVKSRRTNRNISLYCTNSCKAYIGFDNFDKFNSSINPTYIKLTTALISYNLGGRPSWNFSVPGQRFGLANPPNYNPNNLINQYGRLKGTGGMPLRNF